MTTVRIRISATIDNEYENRCPEGMPENIGEGLNDLTIEEARWVLSDAEYNCDPKAQTVGPYDMPLPVFNAYKALAKQARAAIAKVAA